MTITDIFAEIRSLTDTDSTSYPDAVILRRVNAAYEEIVGDIIQLDGTFQFDDSNYTNLPIGTLDLVAGQQDYSFDIRFLSFERAEVKDVNGKYQLLTPIDKAQINMAMSEYQNVPGLPCEYDKNGESLFLYPAPAAANVTLASGLKVYFQRTASIFTTGEVATGTKEPGFASPFHMVLAYKAALPYCISYKKDRVTSITNEINRLQGNKELGIVGAIPRFYARREKDVRKTLTMKRISFR